jgi:3-deoxy-manno-octulosonate cytidylyltransferase (CMP-KDO synthetase)
LEAAEKIECIRYLEHGKKIKMVRTHNVNYGIDSPSDLERAKQHLKKQEFK